MGHVTAPIQLRHHAVNRKFRRLIDGLQRNLLVTPEELSDILQITPAHLHRGMPDPDIEQLSRLASRFRFSLERFFTDEIDLDVIRQHLNGDHLALSARYLPGGFSKRNIIINMLNFIEATKGRRLKVMLMDHLYLTDAIYFDPGGSVNVLLFEDATQYLFKMNLRPSDIVHMGGHSIFTNRKTPFANRLGEHRSVREMFEYYLTDLIKSVEMNNLYRLHALSSTECLLESHENPELLDILKVKHVGGIGRCLYRAGALAAAPAYMGLPNARVSEKTCVHRGDRFCSFHIDFSMASIAEAAR
jgi:hypothetical protein